LYSLTEDEAYVVDQATAALTRECLAAEGFDPDVVEVTAPEPGNGPVEVDESLGLVRPESAAFGYHGDPGLRYGEAGSLGYHFAAKGDAGFDATMDCLEHANATLQGSDEPADEKLPWDLKHGAEAEAAADPRVQAAMGEWSACMSSEGHDYARPTEPWAGPNNPWSFPDCEGSDDPDCGGERPPISQLEIDVATADLACKAEVGLVGLYRVALWEAQERLIEGNLPTLERRLELEKALLVRAQKVLAQVGG
jgi:hypothetical protein